LRAICRKAGIGEDWTPRELRHSFVSLLSGNGMGLEEISRLVGHSSTLVTQTVYRHELRPVVTSGAEMMDRIFADGAKGLFRGECMCTFAPRSDRGSLRRSAHRRRSARSTLVAGRTGCEGDGSD